MKHTLPAWFLFLLIRTERRWRTVAIIGHRVMLFLCEKKLNVLTKIAKYLGIFNDNKYPHTILIW